MVVDKEYFEREQRKRQLREREWMLEFVERGGLSVLLKELDQLGGPGTDPGGTPAALTRAMSQLQVVKCIREVMNSKAGLSFLLDNGDHLHKLVNGLDSQNPTVKMQIFELLCALCVYSEIGHTLALDSLFFFTRSRGMRYRFEPLINELKTSESEDYSATIVAFANCLVQGADSLEKRVRLRNELISLGFTTEIARLKREGASDALCLQIETFDELREQDEDQLILTSDLLSLSHYQLYQKLYEKLSDTPHALHLHSLLLNLIQVDPDNPNSDTMWSLVEDVTSRTLDGSLKLIQRRVNTMQATTRNSSTQTPRARGGRRWNIAGSKARTKSSMTQTTDLQFQVGKIERMETNFENVINFANISSIEPPIVIGREIETQTEHCNRTDISIQTENDVQFSNVSSVPPPPPPMPNNNTPHLQLPNNSIASPSVVSSIPLPPPLPMNIIPNTTITTSSVPSNIPPAPPMNMMTPPNMKTIPPAPPVNTLPANIIPPAPPLPPPMNTSPLFPPAPPLPPSMNTSPLYPPAPPLPPPMNTSPLSTIPPAPPPPLPMNTPNSGPSPPMNVSPPPPPPMDMGPPPMLTPEQYFSLPTRHSLPACLPSEWKPEESSLIRHNSLLHTTKRMKTLNWIKIPLDKDFADTVWKDSSVPRPVPIDIKQMEELFCQRSSNATSTPRPYSCSAIPSPSPNCSNSESATLNVLDSKRSLGVNIMLRQFKEFGVDGLLQAIKDGRSDKLGADKLRNLLKNLPETDEISLIKTQLKQQKQLEEKGGPHMKLGNAEDFYLRLTEIPAYTIRVRAMLQREEFGPSAAELRPQLSTVLNACNALVTNASLREFLTLILHLGNVLNAGSYAGNAVGFRLSTLPRLLETRANKPRMTFLHFAVDVATAYPCSHLAFLTELNIVHAAARLSLESITEEVKTLVQGIKRLKEQIQRTQNSEITSQFAEFLSMAGEEVTDLETKLVLLDDASARLARHFCEDEAKFQLTECLSLIADFISKTELARKENEQRRIQEARIAKQTAARASGVKRSRRVCNSTDSSDGEEMCVVDKLLKEIRSGTFKLRRCAPA